MQQVRLIPRGKELTTLGMSREAGAEVCVKLIHDYWAARGRPVRVQVMRSFERIVVDGKIAKEPNIEIKSNMVNGWPP